jgi:hypothetical protein
MTINPKHGIDNLLFGMKQKDVEAIYGKPNKQFRDDDKNIIHVYDHQKWRLTYYADEDFRLGYIIAANPELELFGQKVIGKKAAEVKEALLAHHFKTWENEDFDLAENHFNEDHWLILQTEFGAITKIEIGAIINNKDEFDWKFGNK